MWTRLLSRVSLLSHHVTTYRLERLGNIHYISPRTQQAVARFVTDETPALPEGAIITTANAHGAGF